MTAKTVVAIRHLAFEGLGAFAPVLAEHGYRLRYLDVGIDDLARFDPLAPDLLIVLGGPIGAYEDDRYPFLAREAALIERRLAAQRPALGVCLGAQLMARALGARVYPGSAKEIGFAPLTLTAEGEASCLSVFGDAPVLHWHGDTFDLPDGCTHLASTPVCENQAFAFGRAAIGLQFHPEAGGDGFERWLIGHACELGEANIDVSHLREEAGRMKPVLRANARACLDHWLRAFDV